MGCCYRKSSIEKYVDFDEYRNQQIDFEDYPILTDLMMNSDFGLIPKALSVYRKHRDSHSHKADSYLKVKLYFAEKYNYSKTEVTKIHQVHDEHMLHNASLTSNKKSGRQHYKPCAGLSCVISCILYQAKVTSQENSLLFFEKSKTLSEVNHHPQQIQEIGPCKSHRRSNDSV